MRFLIFYIKARISSTIFSVASNLDPSSGMSWLENQTIDIFIIESTNKNCPCIPTQKINSASKVAGNAVKDANNLVGKFWKK